MIGNVSGSVSGITTLAILLALFFYGLIYNHYVGKLKESRPTFPASILVVIGTLITTVGAWALDLVNGWGVLVCNLAAFSASGLAMVLGDVWRSTDPEHQAARIARRQARHNIGYGRLMAEVELGDTEEALAEGGEDQPEG